MGRCVWLDIEINYPDDCIRWRCPYWMEDYQVCSFIFDEDPEVFEGDC